MRKQVPGDPSCNVKPEIYESRRQNRPPIQPIVEKGDILIRDLRTWHAGMPNESEMDRIMVAVGYQVRLYPPQGYDEVLVTDHILLGSMVSQP